MIDDDTNQHINKKNKGYIVNFEIFKILLVIHRTFYMNC